MHPPQLVSPPRRSLAELGEIIGDQRLHALTTAADDLRSRLGGRTVWQVNSTASGGGVAEMLNVLVGYILDAGVSTRWLVVDGDGDFFEVTKRLHNRLHGAAAGPELSDRDAACYSAVTTTNAASVAEFVQPGDVVILHDPQTAGLAAGLAAHGAIVVWRCHIGADRRNPVSDDAWQFLRPHLQAAQAYVFSVAR